ncbi:MAG TPA: AAA family ATPase [Acidimicrobiales bacterium]|nr:AAA family ATPase [Acidimicrobiales bacterium]
MSEVDPPRVDETHLSWVFQAGDRAYKVLKPVTLPFLDHTTDEARIAAATAEFELNRRTAPDVYLGLADVHEGSRLVDRMIVMRRLPSDRRLSRLAAEGDISGCLRDVARAVAVFHARQPPVAVAPMASAAAHLRNWHDNMDVTNALEGAGASRRDLDRVRELAVDYLAGRERLFDRRIAEGFVRDGHGDLIADDVFCLDDGPRIIDCLAFDDDWRIGDVLLDIGFLVMDVHRLAGREPAQRLLGWYQEFSGEHHPASLSHHYVAYRAHVRAKVACLRWQQGDEASADLAMVYHDLALHHLEHGRVRLVMVGGVPGAGKTVLSEGLAGRLGCASLSTDELRKDVVGIGRGERRPAAPGEGIYDDETRDAIYAEQLREAAALLGQGESVVLDASWTHEAHRERARQVAAAAHAGLVEIECRVEPGLAKARIERRRSDPSSVSDATAEVVDHLAGRRDPWPNAIPLDTTDSPEIVLERACGLITGDR